MDEILKSLFNKIDLLLGALIALIGKKVYDRTQENKKAVIDGEAPDVSLDSSVTRRDSVMIWLTDRIHKLRNEVDIPINKNIVAIEELKFRTTYMEKAAAEEKIENAARIARLHDHIDQRSDKLEGLIEKIRENK